MANSASKPAILLAEKLAYSIPETAQLSGSSRSSIYIEIKEGRLKASKIGRRTVITKDAFQAWLGNLEVVA